MGQECQTGKKWERGLGDVSVVIKTMPQVKGPMGQGKMDVKGPGCLHCSYTAHQAWSRPPG